MPGEGDADYAELVEDTIDEIKQKVEDSDFDLEQVIEAERQNKNRKTLLAWLEERRDTDPADEQREEPVDESRDEEDTDTTSTDTVFSSPSRGTPLFERRVPLVVAGVMIGLMLATAVFTMGLAPATGGQQTVSAQVAADNLDTYVDDNKEAMQLPPGADLRVQSIDAVPNADLYEATLHLSMSIEDQELEQDIPAYLTADGRYVFFSQPFDTARPLDEQVQQQPAQPQQP